MNNEKFQDSKRFVSCIINYFWKYPVDFNQWHAIQMRARETKEILSCHNLIIFLS
jgi:hypothetical protein